MCTIGQNVTIVCVCVWVNMSVSIHEDKKKKTNKCSDAKNFIDFNKYLACGLPTSNIHVFKIDT